MRSKWSDDMILFCTFIQWMISTKFLISTCTTTTTTCPWAWWIILRRTKNTNRILQCCIDFFLIRICTSGKNRWNSWSFWRWIRICFFQWTCSIEIDFLTITVGIGIGWIRFILKGFCVVRWENFWLVIRGKKMFVSQLNLFSLSLSPFFLCSFHLPIRKQCRENLWLVIDSDDHLLS